MSKERMTDYQRGLIEQNVNLARFIALDRWRKIKYAVEKDEILAAAYQGLVTAALLFDPTREAIKKEDLENGKAFAGYARLKINGAILDWQRSQDHVPKRKRRIYRDLQENGLGTGKTPEELAAITGLDVDKVRAITQAVEMRDVSLNEVPSWRDAENDLPDSTDVESSVLTGSIANAVIHAIDGLTPLQQSVVVLRYYQGLDLPRIATELGVSSIAVRTNHREAIEIIHVAMISAVQGAEGQYE